MNGKSHVVSNTQHSNQTYLYGVLSEQWFEEIRVYGLISEEDKFPYRMFREHEFLLPEFRPVDLNPATEQEFR